MKSAEPWLPGLPFTGPWLLAPMEGVTDPAFRDLVLMRNRPEDLGGAFTEFVRVVRDPLPERTLRGHLGPHRFATPVGLQLMGSDLGALAESAHRAERVGAPMVDLNFGCPSKGALKGCAGSALLDDPSAVERTVSACADALDRIPLTAKIRAGGSDASLVEELAQAVEAGGAQLLTVHCRTRKEAYTPATDWTRLARAVAATRLPVCGNGGIARHPDLERMRRETGVRLVMVGRAAIGDPWIFSGREVSRAAAARFLLDYGEELFARGARPRQVLARQKQLLREWTAGDLVGGEAERLEWLRELDPERARARLAALAGDEPPLSPRATGPGAGAILSPPLAAREAPIERLEPPRQRSAVQRSPLG